MYLQVKNNQNMSENCQKFEKKINSEVITHQKNLAKCTNFEVSSLGFELQVSSLGLGVFDEVSVSKFWPGLGLEGYSLDYLLVK